MTTEQLAGANEIYAKRVVVADEGAAVAWAVASRLALAQAALDAGGRAAVLDLIEMMDNLRESLATEIMALTSIRPGLVAAANGETPGQPEPTSLN